MISVCIATYNGQTYIKEQIVSILKQLSLEDEIIISDDNSSDDTIKIIISLNDKRIKIFSNKKKLINHRSSTHIYATSNFENAINNAKGDYIFLSDQDDIWLEGKINSFIQEMSENNKMMVFSNFSVIDLDKNVAESRYYKKNPIKKNAISNLIRMPFFGCTLAFRKELLEYILPFPQHLILHDNWIGFLALHYGEVSFIDKPFILYRRHINNVSSYKGHSKNPIWYRISYRLQFIMQYFQRIQNKKKGPIQM